MMVSACAHVNKLKGTRSYPKWRVLMYLTLFFSLGYLVNIVGT
ncbi:MAG: hypothetical protein ACTSU5_08690 [Promethearchaeota archaeon]